MDNNTTIDFLLLVADKTLNTANAATSALNTYLVFGTIFIAFAALVSALIGIWLSYKFRQDKKKLIAETKDELLRELANNGDIKNKLIDKILTNNTLLKKIVSLKEFREQLDECVADHIDILNGYKDDNTLPFDIYESENFTLEDEAFLKDIDITIDNEINLERGENGIK